MITATFKAAVNEGSRGEQGPSHLPSLNPRRSLKFRSFIPYPLVSQRPPLPIDLYVLAPLTSGV